MIAIAKMKNHLNITSLCPPGVSSAGSVGLASSVMALAGEAAMAGDLMAQTHILNLGTQE